MIKYGFFIFALLFSVIVYASEVNLESQSNATQLLWPLPKSVSFNIGQISPLPINPCLIDYKVIATPSNQIEDMIKWYLEKIYKCKENKNRNSSSISPTFFIVVRDPSVMYAEDIQHEKYYLYMRNSANWELFADYYVGFLRGFQTFTQLIQKTKTSQYFIESLPIQIDDEPSYKWRGLMIDSARHFKSLDLIRHTIDGMLFNKMNILHWHIVQEDSFPVFIPERPELSQFGEIAGVYQTEDLKEIIEYAKVRGVRVIPEIDSPAHTTSWGRSQKYSSIALNCNGIYKGQFDPTLDLTYQVLEDVMKYFTEIFPDSFFHFGGDEVTEQCWDQRPKIKQFMQRENISDYIQLQIYYRKRQKKLYQDKISKSKRIIYWANQQIDLPMDDDDIIQWWGEQKTLEQLQGRKNDIILSNYDQTYLDVGFGDKDGTDYRTYISWREVYNLNPKDKRLQNLNVIGGQVCMWSEMVDQSNHDQKVWIRASALAQRLWNINIDKDKELLNIVKRLIKHRKRMKDRGFKASAVTVGLCQKDPSICFH